MPLLREGHRSYRAALDWMAPQRREDLVLAGEHDHGNSAKARGMSAFKTPDVATEVLERLKFAAMQSFHPAMVESAEMDVVTDFLTENLCARLAVLVYGKKGPTAIEQRTYTTAALPRWLPKWLRKRWTRAQTIQLDATPMLLFPDASFIPADKFGPAYFYVDKHTRSVENPSWREQ